MKMMLLKKLMVSGLIGASFAAATAHAADLLDEVKQRGTLRVGLEGTFPPFNSKNPQGELVGFDVDIAKAVAAKLGVKPEFVTTEWSGIIAGLQAGKFDVIVNQVGITDKRKDVLDFSPAYTYSAAQLIQRKDDARQFKSLEDLKGKKLGVGGIFSGEDARAKLAAGASLVQLYTGFIYRGPALVSECVKAIARERTS